VSYPEPFDSRIAIDKVFVAHGVPRKTHMNRSFPKPSSRWSNKVWGCR